MNDCRVIRLENIGSIWVVDFACKPSASWWQRICPKKLQGSGKWTPPGSLSADLWIPEVCKDGKIKVIDLLPSKTYVIVLTWHREGPKCHVCSFAVMVMNGMVTPIKRSAKARDTMNLWKRWRRNFFDLRMMLISTVFAKMITIAVMSLNIVFGDVNSSNISNDSHPTIVSFSVTEDSFSSKRPSSRSSRSLLILIFKHKSIGRQSLVHINLGNVPSSTCRLHIEAYQVVR